VTTETALRRGRRRGKGSKGTVASPEGRRWGRFGQRRAGSGAIAGGGARVLRGNWRWWRRLRAPAANSTDGEEEGDAVNLGACSSARGEAASGGAGRQPWWRCSGAHREEEERANGETSEGEKGREEAVRRRHQGGAPRRPGASRRWQRWPQALPRRCLRWKKGKIAENPLPLEGFPENSKTELVLELSKL
jgi:hypothetical protein